MRRARAFLYVKFFKLNKATDICVESCSESFLLRTHPS
uniref:Uncharacterized protein n=1 Tax=Anguilla anguilla TaxID=7936 RepID=A0A0E9QBL0_ANGAN